MHLFLLTENLTQNVYNGKFSKAPVTRIRFQIDPLWIVYSNVCVFVIVFIVSNVNRRWNRNDIVAFSNENVFV